MGHVFVAVRATRGHHWDVHIWVEKRMMELLKSIGDGIPGSISSCTWNSFSPPSSSAYAGPGIPSGPRVFLPRWSAAALNVEELGGISRRPFALATKGRIIRADKAESLGICWNVMAHSMPNMRCFIIRCSNSKVIPSFSNKATSKGKGQLNGAQSFA